MTRCRTLLIYNPTAGPWDTTRLLKRLAVYMQREGWLIELVQTQRPGDATRYAREAAVAGCALVLVAGGDGTVNEAANGLLGTDTVLGIVPVGTGNILAHQLRMPILTPGVAPNVGEIGTALFASRVQRVDVGKIDGRCFVGSAGLGLDAEVAAHIEPRTRSSKRLRTLPYIIAAFSIAAEFRGVRTRITIEDQAVRTRVLMVVVSNIQLYAAYFNIAPRARMDDGLLDIFVFKGLGFGYALRHLLSLSQGRSLDNPKITHALARTVCVETSPAVAVHLDGEPVGDTPTEVGIAPRALRLLAPPSTPESLFGAAPEQWGK